MKTSSCDVLIVGAGPTGLMFANLLLKSGITNFRLLDQNEGPTPESRAIGIQAKTLELMKNIGVVDEFLKRGLVSKGARVFLHGKKRFEISFEQLPFPDTPYPYVFFLSQTETENILIEEIEKSGIPIERRTQFISLNQNETGVESVVIGADGSPETIHSQFLIGCDGSHSKVRRELGLEFKGAPYPAEFIMADSKVDWDLSADKLTVFLETGSVGVFFPLSNEHSRVLTTRVYEKNEVIPSTEATTSSPATLSEIEEGLRRTSHRNIKLSNPTWVTKFHVHHRSVSQTKIGNVFLAGDSSHIHSPVGAQGMNTGLQDAANLTWKLAAVLKKQAATSILETYHSERWPIGQKLLNFTDRAFNLAVSKNFLFIQARNIFLPVITKLLSRFKAGQIFLFKFVSQLGIHYHKSEVVQEMISSSASETFKTTLPSGNRAPNAKINHENSVFDLITGYQFHVLVLIRKNLSHEEIEELKKVWDARPLMQKYKAKVHIIFSGHLLTNGTGLSSNSEEIFKRYGVTDQALFLVRPDGYIGYRTDDLWRAFI
ncbi:MAG: FAD-dependent monooxygenase [Pseudobdellovibrionaceae bacterium]